MSRRIGMPPVKPMMTPEPVREQEPETVIPAETSEPEPASEPVREQEPEVKKGKRK